MVKIKTKYLTCQVSQSQKQTVTENIEMIRLQVVLILLFQFLI